MSIERRYANIGHQHDALDIAFDNTDSGLAAEDVQEAIDELATGAGGYPPQLGYAGIF
jgi:hypothetical protein